MIAKESTSYKQHPNESTFVAWIHNHSVNGKCQLSSIDLHKQFKFEQSFPQILAIIVEIGVKGKLKHDYFQVSIKGMDRISACIKTELVQDLNVLHKSCSFPRFSKSLKEHVTMTMCMLTVIDSRTDETSVQSVTNDNDQNGNEIEGEEIFINCKNCKKEIRQVSILYHLRSKKCRQQYSDQEYSRLQQERKETLKGTRKKCFDRYNAANYDKTKEKIRKRQTRTNHCQRLTFKDRILAFKRDIIDGPNFVCFSCNRSLFKCSVKILETKDISGLLKKMDDNVIQEADLESCQSEEKLILCHTCFQNFNSKKFPSLNVNNGLKLDDVPEELACLADLEQQLIAQLLIFMKIKKLPTTRMGAVVDRVISVPIENEDVSR